MTTRRIALVAACWVGAACGWTDTPELAQPIPPAALTYGANPATYVKGAAIPANSPHSSGGAVKSYEVAPTLPDGLTLDPTSGVLSGTPGAVTPLTTYLVTATNEYGSATASLDLTVNDAPPSGLAYGLNPAVYTQATAIAPNVPSSTGGGVTSYAIAPALPAGLVLSPQTGVISGTPTTAAAQATYTVTASNVSGDATAKLTIEVKERPPAGLSYTVPTSLVRGTAMQALTPTLVAGVARAFTISPALPGGISLDSASGVIGGTPSQLAASTTYTVTASNGTGNTSTALTFAVVDVTTPSASFQSPIVTWNVGQFNSVTPTATGAAVDEWLLTTPPGGLLSGLSFNTATGTISGTPTTSGAGVYLVSPKNSLGYGLAAAISITVQ